MIHWDLHNLESGSIAISFIISALLISILLSVNVAFDDSFAAPYANYTSDIYKIHFEYPAGWEVVEKKSGFNEGADIELSSHTILGGSVLIFLINNSAYHDMDLRSYLNQAFNMAISANNDREYNVVEQPDITTIDNQQAGTFLFTSKDKYDSNGVRLAIQDWVVKTPNSDYLISYVSTPDIFDNPSSEEIRDHFINSIRLLNVGNATQSNIKK
jgi:hypothetical protein